MPADSTLDKWTIALDAGSGRAPNDRSHLAAVPRPGARSEFAPLLEAIAILAEPIPQPHEPIPQELKPPVVQSREAEPHKPQDVPAIVRTAPSVQEQPRESASRTMSESHWQPRANDTARPRIENPGAGSEAGIAAPTRTMRIASAPVVVTSANVGRDEVVPADNVAGFIRFHPKFRDWLQKCGVTSALAALELPGEVVCGHADRHVVRVELRAGVRPRIAYLKREHVVGRRTRWRNRRAGFGSVSRSQREAVTLDRLEVAGLPGPQWLAYGEDGAGRAFLLVDELAGAIDVRELLGEQELAPEARGELAIRAGQAVAELHAAGFATPELCAKHLFVRPAVNAISIIDWQSSGLPGQEVTLPERTRSLALLHATLAEQLVTPSERLRFLWSYRRTLRNMGRDQLGQRFSTLVRGVAARAEKLASRSSVRAQRRPVEPLTQQRLVWLAGEAVVAVPEVAASWPKPAIIEPYYPATPMPTPADGLRERVTLASGHRGVMIRFHTFDILARLSASLRERPWRSPAATAARVLFHLQKHGVPGPRLLAFGQRTVSRFGGESFVVAEPPVSAVPVAVRLVDPSLLPAERRTILALCGRRLRQLHDAGCRPVLSSSSNDPLFVVSGEAGEEIAVASPFAIRLARRLSKHQLCADIRRVQDSLESLTRKDRLWLLRGYMGEDWRDRGQRRKWSR